MKKSKNWKNITLFFSKDWVLTYLSSRKHVFISHLFTDISKTLQQSSCSDYKHKTMENYDPHADAPREQQQNQSDENQSQNQQDLTETLKSPNQISNAEETESADLNDGTAENAEQNTGLGFDEPDPRAPDENSTEQQPVEFPPKQDAPKEYAPEPEQQQDQDQEDEDPESDPPDNDKEDEQDQRSTFTS